MIRLSILLMLCLIQVPALAQSQFFSGASKSQMKGVSGSAGVGFANFTLKAPSDSVRLDRGAFAILAGERAFGFMNLYLTFSLDYLTTTGLAQYDYTTLGGTAYKVKDVTFRASIFQAGLGLKLKLIDGYWFRPYVEGGGLGGYYQIRYTNNEDKMKTIGTDYKLDDSIMDAGYYGEAGLEINFSEMFGLRLAARLATNKTAEIETLKDQQLEYQTQTYSLAMLAQF